jgi:hypothetical protein
MDVILLRKLTRKSVMGFGQYSEMSVGQIIDIQKSHYLVWVYYYLSNISFCDEILDKLYIWPRLRIEKPGKDPEMIKEYEKCCKVRIGHLDNLSFIKMKVLNKKNKRVSKIRFEAYHKIDSDKRKLQRYNQGHR